MMERCIDEELDNDSPAKTSYIHRLGTLSPKRSFMNMIRLNICRHSHAFLFACYLCCHIQISPSRQPGVASAFSPLLQPSASVRRESANSQCLLRMSEPSDTSSDSFYEYVDVDSEETQPTNDEALVLNVLDLIPEDHRAGFATSGITEETRTAINEALYKLEALHARTSDPAVSPLLNGVWQLRYVGGYASQWALPSPTRQLALFLYSGGYSPGIFALGLAQNLPRPFVEVGRDVEVAISRTQPRVEASVAVKFLGGAESSVKVRCRLEVQSDVRLRETYESFSVLDQAPVTIPEALQYSRDLYVTYLDEDLLVVRDASGVPEILTRKDKTFRNNWGYEPSAMQDMVAPGES